MPRGKPNVEQGSDPRTNKAEAVRQAMDKLGFDASPLMIQKFIKDNFDQDMSANMISSYKSNERTKKGLAGRRKKRGRPKKNTTAAAVPTASSHDAVPWKDLRTIKDIAGRIGKKNLRELVEWLD
jgi:ribosomal protein L19E